MSRRYPRNHLDHMLESAAYGSTALATAGSLEELAVLATERGLSVRFADQGTRLLVDLPGDYARLPFEIRDLASLERCERIIAREAAN